MYISKLGTHQVSHNFLPSLMLCSICKILANLIAILVKSDWNKCFNSSVSVTLSALLFSLIVTKTGPSRHNIHWINLYSQVKQFSKTNYAIHCRLVIYPVDVIIVSLHNWAQDNWTLHCQVFGLPQFQAHFFSGTISKLSDKQMQQYTDMACLICNFQ